MLAHQEGLEGGHVTAIRVGGEDRIVVSGLAVRMGADGTEHPVGPRIWVDGVGALPFPAGEEGVSRAILPVVVPLGEDAWGALWAETVDLPPHVPRVLYRELYWAQNDAGVWRGPRQLVSADIHLLWASRRPIRFSAAGEPFVLVGGSGMKGWQAFFGTPARGIEAVDPLGGQVGVSGFTIDGDRIVLAAGAPLPEIVVLESADRGETWSQPRVIGHSRLGFSRLAVERDGSGNLHVVVVGRDSIQHFVRLAGAEDWWSTAFPTPAPVILNSAFGVNRCGRPALFLDAFEPPERRDVAMFEWTAAGGWSGPWPTFEGYFGGGLFEGRTRDGRWFIGTNAVERERLHEGYWHIRIAEP
jgi:hypothetical protein